MLFRSSALISHDDHAINKIHRLYLTWLSIDVATPGVGVEGGKDSMQHAQAHFNAHALPLVAHM